MTGAGLIVVVINHIRHVSFLTVSDGPDVALASHLVAR